MLRVRNLALRVQAICQRVEGSREPRTYAGTAALKQARETLLFGFAEQLVLVMGIQRVKFERRVHHPVTSRYWDSCDVSWSNA